MLAIFLLALGILSRLIIHLPNFTPVIAISLFSGVYLKKKYAMVMPVALMIMTDIMLGLYPSVLFTWLAIAGVVFLGFRLRGQRNPVTVLGFSLFSALLFFVMSNFGVWLLSGLYAHTWQGFISCYVMAIPFFRNSLLSTGIFAIILFGVYEIVAARIRNTRLAHVLL